MYRMEKPQSIENIQTQRSDIKASHFCIPNPACRVVSNGSKAPICKLTTFVRLVHNWRKIPHSLKSGD